jgi:hypothetical protein
LGTWNLSQLLEGLEGFTLRLFTSVLKWRVEEVHVLLGLVRKELMEQKAHCYWDL